ncbi:hypothetical protein WR25_21481, partial [Diploscapter pachys]
IRLAGSRKVIDMSDPGCLYKSYDDYIKRNKLQPSVLLYPENGTYAELKIELKALESPSCTFTSDVAYVVSTAITVVSVASTFLTPICVFGGPALASMAARTSISGSFWAASMFRGAALLNTTSRYLSTANAITTALGLGFTGVGIFNKLRRGETFYSEALTIITAALNCAYARIQARIKKATLEGETWSEISKRISTSDKLMLFFARLVPTVTSVASLLCTFYNLLMNPHRTMYDITTFSISLFMFTNTLIKPWTLHTMFTEIGDDIIQELRGRFKADSSLDRFEEDLRKAAGDEYKHAFLIRNLYRIEDLEGFYDNMWRTESTVEFNKNGFVLNKNIPMGPEFYNQIGKEQIVKDKIMEKFHLANGRNADRSIESLMKGYDDSLVDEAKRFAKGLMTADEERIFSERLVGLEQNRKKLLFEVSAEYKDAKNLLETTERAERELSGGKTLEEWQAEKKVFIANNNTDNNPGYDQRVHELDQRIETAEGIRGQCNAFYNSLDDSNASNNSVSGFEQKIAEIAGGEYISKTNKFINDIATFAKVERMTTSIDAATTKHSLQNAFHATNYRDITINGQAVFANLSDIELCRISGYFNDPEKANKLVDLSRKLLESENCTWKGSNAGEIGDGMKLIGQYVVS